MTFKEDDAGDGFKIASLIISIVITIFGLFGNSVVIFVISILKEYKKSITHWYVLQLAIADTIFLLSLPFNASQNWTGMWAFSEWLCKLKEAALYLNCYASIFFLMVMSIDRYIAICWSQSSIASKIRNRKFAYSVTAVIWIGCLLLCIPLLMYSYKIGNEPNCKCSYEFPKTIDPDLCKDEKEFSEFFYQECLSSKTTNTKRCSYQEQPPTEENKFNSSIEYDKTNTTILNVINIPTSIFYYSGSGDIDLYDYTNTESYTTASHDQNLALLPDCHFSKQSEYLFTFLYFNFFGLFIVPFVVMVVCYGLIVKRIFDARVRTNIPVSTSSTQTSTSRRPNRNRSHTRADKDRLRVTIMCVALVSSFVIFWLPFHAVHLAKIAGITGTSSGFCRNIIRIVTFFVYLNSALNPYLYSFLGKQFFRRLSLACGSLEKLARRGRVSSTGSSFSFKQRSSGSKGGLSSNKTQTTKFQRTKLSSKNTGSFSHQHIEGVSHYDGTR